ncbi:MAG: hypothetical protein ABSE15_10485 [Candidatus Bathyarchaeia archaeon]|jgi:hypothetical protein
MLKQLNGKSRKALRNKLAEVFIDEIKVLPVDMQNIFLDDLVTAFENRLSMFTQVKSSLPLMEFELADRRTERVVA